MNATLYAFEWFAQAQRRAGPKSVFRRKRDSGHDPAGNRTRQLANLGTPIGSATYYDYNAAQRKQRAAPAPRASSAGNATPANELTHLHVLGGAFGGIEPGHSYFQYDATGNLTQQQEPDGTTYYSYTPFNLVSSIHHKDDTWTRCWYDGNLRRYALEDDTHGLRYFTWDQNGLNLLTEQDPTGTVTRRYTHGYTPIKGIGSITYAGDPETGDYAAPCTNHQGSVLATVDDTGSVTDYHYNAFGFPLSSLSAGPVTDYHYNAFGFPLSSLSAGPVTTSRLRYHTNWLTLAESLSLSPTRIYSRLSGQFLQPDPLLPGLIGGRTDLFVQSVSSDLIQGYTSHWLSIASLGSYAGQFASLQDVDSLGLADNVFFEISDLSDIPDMQNRFLLDPPKVFWRWYSKWSEKHDTATSIALDPIDIIGKESRKRLWSRLNIRMQAQMRMAIEEISQLDCGEGNRLKVNIIWVTRQHYTAPMELIAAQNHAQESNPECGISLILAHGPSTKRSFEENFEKRFTRPVLRECGTSKFGFIACGNQYLSDRDNLEKDFQLNFHMDNIGDTPLWYGLVNFVVDKDKIKEQIADACRCFDEVNFSLYIGSLDDHRASGTTLIEVR